MANMMKCDREGCENTKVLEWGVVPQEGRWIVVTDRQEHKEYTFCSFKCGIAVAREKAAAEPPDDPKAARDKIVALLDGDEPSFSPFLLHHELEKQRGHLTYSSYNGGGITGRGLSHQYRTWARVLQEMERGLAWFVERGWEEAE